MTRALLVALCALAALGPATSADAYWRAGGSGSGSGTAATMPTANQPSTMAAARSVTVTWTQNTFQGSPLGSYAGGGYQLKRYAQGSSTGVTPSANCATTISGTSATLQCVETGVPYGDWQYSVTPVLNSFTGGESAKSATVTVAAPQLSFSSSTTVTSLPTTLAGSISRFAAGQSVTFKLDNPTTGTTVSGSISPSPVPGSGSASVNVTIPAGTADGAHSVYAVGNQGDTASAAITVQALDHFDIDAVAEQHSGKSFVVTAHAKDAAGATITAFNGTVNFSVNSGSISPTTSNSFSNGVLTQAVTVTGAYTTSQTITATGGSPSKTGTSNAFTLHDWKYYFKKTTAYTASSCASATRLRDMEEGYPGADPEETFSRTTGGAIHLRFCSPAFAAGATLAAGTTTVQAYVNNAAGSGCGIRATLYKNSGGTTTALGNTNLSIPAQTGVTLRTWTMSTTVTTFAAGDRLNLSFTQSDVKACDSTDIHYGGTTYRSNVQLPGPGGSAYSDTLFATSGLISYWRLNETTGTSAADAQGSNTGTYANGVTLGANGLLQTDSDKAVSFDGVDDAVTVPDSSSLSPTAQMSIEAWVRPTNVSGHRNIATKDWILRVDTPSEGNQFSFFVNVGGAYEPRVKSGVVPSANTTYHVVGTYDGSNLRIYVNGDLKGTQPRSGAIVDGPGNLSIGGSSWWNGTIDEVAFYNTALSATQVGNHYHAR